MTKMSPLLIPMLIGLVILPRLSVDLYFPSLTHIGLYFNTTDKTVTPTLQDVGIGFYSSCVPSGQAFWNGLGTGTYTVTASKSGYQDTTTSVTVGSGWQEVKLIMQ